MNPNDFPVADLEKALAALQAERTARKEARRADPSYDPAFILMHPAEDDSRVLADAKRRHPGVRDFELIASRIERIRPEMTSPESLAADATALERAQSARSEVWPDQD